MGSLAPLRGTALTTYAAITSMEQDHIQQLFIKALHAAHRRAAELGDEFGA